jgi:hypothetical protein
VVLNMGTRWHGCVQCLAVTLWICGCTLKQESQVQSTNRTAKELYENCVSAMVAGVCAATSGSSSAKQASGTVLVAGVGRVDAKFYVKLREAGSSMCELITEPCTDDWEGSKCKTVRALWSAKPGPIVSP